jgi:hypothetical protein
MEGNKSIWLRLLTKKGVSPVNKNVVIFVFFLFLAFVFWYLNHLGKEIKSEFRFSVSYINSPKGREVSGDLPPKLTLEIKGQGYSLLKYKIRGNKSPLLIDLSKLTFKRIPATKPVRYFILTTGLVPGFNKQLGNGLEVLNVKPDTIFLIFKVIENIPDKKIR